MKSYTSKLLNAAALLIALNSTFSTLHAQGTAFTYSGKLNAGSAPANGVYDLTFSLFSLSSGGSALVGPLTNSAIGVTNGLFTVTLDFGSVFNGANRWLETGVRTNGPGAFTTLTPRQPITPTPYAIYSEGSGFATTANNVAANGVSAPQLNTPATPSSGQVLGFNGTSLAWLNPSAAASAWNLGGNSGTTAGPNYVGTSDNQPLELVSAGNRALELAYSSRNSGNPLYIDTSSINVFGGYWGNGVAYNVVGATIAGGGYETGGSLSATYPNNVTGDFGSVGGGYNNSAGYSATVPGGNNNSATGNGSFAAGHNAKANGNGDFVWADSQNSNYNSSGNDQFCVRAQGGVQLDPTTSLFFGFRTRQMLNLYDVVYGIGVQDYTLYQRTAATGGFAWYAGGTHSDTQNDPGSGGKPLMTLDNTGTLTVNALTILGGADLAEPFRIADAEIPKGAVVIIDEENPGKLKLSDRAYDTRVAGVVSGANEIHPGLRLQQQGALDGGQYVALTGRVYVQADARFGVIKPGDLLTTSDTPGYAMRVNDFGKAQGAILGKAMGPLKEGKGVVLILVTLQ